MTIASMETLVSAVEPSNVEELCHEATCDGKQECVTCEAIRADRRRILQGLSDIKHQAVTADVLAFIRRRCGFTAPLCGNCKDSDAACQSCIRWRRAIEESSR
jgi:hypothetical protein